MKKLNFFTVSIAVMWVCIMIHMKRYGVETLLLGFLISILMAMTSYTYKKAMVICFYIIVVGFVASSLVEFIYEPTVFNAGAGVVQLGWAMYMAYRSVLEILPMWRENE